MDIKCIALVLVFLAIGMELSETMPFPRAFLLPPQSIMARKSAKHHSEMRRRAKRSVEGPDKNIDEYMASGLADKPHSRHKRAAFSENIIVVGVMCGLAGVLTLGASIWAVHTFFHRRNRIGATSN